MAAEPEDIADLEQPFSPSVFLNLPPTPPHPDDEDPAALSNDLNHQYPDHQALLQAQQPQPSTDDILSSSSMCTANTNGGVFTLSPCFPDAAPLLGGATWPYDPVELSQKLFSVARTHAPYPADNMARLTMGDAANAAASSHVQDDSSTSVGFWQNGGKIVTPTSAGGDGELHDALFLGGGAGETAQNRVIMEMLN